MKQPDKKPLRWRLRKGKDFEVYWPTKIRIVDVLRNGSVVLEMEPIEEPECFEKPGGD